MSSLQLSLIRHAKAGFPSGATSGDHARRLTKEGTLEAVAMAERLSALPFEPDLVLSSTANRARETSSLLAQGLGWASSIISTRDELYLAGPLALVRCARGCDEGVRHLALVGHNPGLEELWPWLTGLAAQSLPTCGVVMLRLSVKIWSEVDAGSAELIDFLNPANSC